jgi:hypothetical protein
MSKKLCGKNCQEPLLDKLELLKSKTNKCNCLRGEVGGKYVGRKKKVTS